MKRSTAFLVSSWTLALVLSLTTLVGGVAAGAGAAPDAAEQADLSAHTPANLCVAKFNDIDSDGRQGVNEPALTGWTFTIRNAGGVDVGTIGSAPTLGPCKEVPAGTYTVTETAQAGWTPTTSGGLTQSITLSAGQMATVVFGNHQAENGRVCVIKFSDLDGDGKQDPGEPQLGGWDFTITNAAGSVVGTITNSSAVAPTCWNQPPGIYTVTETAQAGWTPTTPGGATQTVTVVSGQTTTVTFGNHRDERGRLCVVKFNDLDGDGRQGPNEPTLFGWVFTIRNAGGVVVGTITIGDFAANCVDLPPGSYPVTETLPAGWTPTTPGGATQTATVSAGQTTTLTFGNRQRERICVTKFNDLDGDGVRDTGEPLLSGWTFTVLDSASNAVVGTLVSGTPRNCLEVKVGTYQVTETLQPGWHATTPGGVMQTVTVALGQTVNVTFGNHRCCLTFTFLGGKVDNFSLANGATAEPVTPALITAAPKYFDARSGNFGLFVHRFSLGTGNCIQSATLELKLKALAGGSSNDTLGIKVAGSSGWSRPISSIAPLVGSWTPSKVKTVLFNLGAMPAGGGSANLIPALNAIRLLDVTIQDDTSVDYARLIVVFCECVHK